MKNNKRLATLSILFICVVILPLKILFAQTDRSDTIALDLLSSEENPRNSEGGFITLNDGRILFAYTRFMDSSSDHAPAQIVGRFSNDGGKTWTEKDHLIVDNEGGQNVMSVSLLRLQNGNISLFYAIKNSLEDCTPHVRFSSDEGKTWSDPQPIIEDQKGYFVLNNDRAIQLDGGRILVPVSLHKTPNSEWSNRGEIRCYFSDNDGKTWKRGQSVPAPSDVIMQEPGVTELRDGKILMNIRANHGVQYKSFSIDKGLTWSWAKRSQIPSPIAPASIKRLPKTGDLILVWNNNGKSGPGYFNSKRSPLSIAISDDEGNNWKYIKNLEGSIHATYAYTAIHQVENHVLFGYYIKHDDKPGIDLRIRRLPVDYLYRPDPLRPVLIAANKDSNTLSYLDPEYLEVLETIQIGNNPHEITISPDQRRAYLSSYKAPGNSIIVVDLIKRQQIDTIDTGKFNRIHGAAFAPDGEHVYFTAGQSGYVIEVETTTNRITRTIPTEGNLAHMIYISPDGRYIVTANINSKNVSVINRESGKLETLIHAGDGVKEMAFTPDGKELWALNQTEGSITIIDWNSKTVLEEIDCPEMPVRLKFTPEGKRAMVVSWEEKGTLAVFDVPSRKEIKRIPVGSHAIGIELSPDGEYTFIGCEDHGKIDVMRNKMESVEKAREESDGVHVVDIQTLKVVKIIKTRLGPGPMQIWWPPNQLIEN